MTFYRFIPLLVAVLAGCGERPTEPTEPQPLLAVDQILNQDRAALVHRLGEPDSEFHRTETVMTIQWKDGDGDRTWVYVDLVDGQAAYVAYTFKGLEPFDLAEALRRVGLSVPTQEPSTAWENGAKRWRPFGRYNRLVVNPVLNLVVVSLI